MLFNFSFQELISWNVYEYMRIGRLVISLKCNKYLYHIYYIYIYMLYF